MEGLKLGKRPATPDDRDITFGVVKAAAPLPTPPGRFGHGTLFQHGTAWLMLGNGPDDSVAPGFGGAGDCVFAGAGHETMLTLHLAGKSVTITGKEAIADYSAVTGYEIGNEQTDQGTNVREALGYRRSTGIVDAHGVRHKIGAYVRIDPKDFDALMQAVFVFSAVGIGFAFPSYAMEQFDHGETWDYVPGVDDDPNEGHYVSVVGRSSKNIAGVISWGRRQGMSREFYETYNDEAWAIVYPEELRNGKTERGMDLSQLQAALASL